MEIFDVKLKNAIRFDDGTLYVKIVPSNIGIEEIIAWEYTIEVHVSVEQTITEQLVLAKPELYAALPEKYKLLYTL